MRSALPEPEDPETLKERQRQERLDNMIIQRQSAYRVKKTG